MKGKNARLLTRLFLIGVVATTTGYSQEVRGDSFSLRIERGSPEGTIITVSPRNEELKKNPAGGPFVVTVSVASTLPLLRRGLFLKSSHAPVPLDTEPPPVSVKVFVEDFEFIVVTLSNVDCFPEWRAISYFRREGSGWVPVDAEKEGLPSGKPLPEDKQKAN